MRKYYFFLIFLIFSHVFCSELTQEGFDAAKLFFKRADIDKQSKCFFATELLKEAIGYYTVKLTEPLTPLNKQFIKLAHKNKANFNLKIKYQGGIYSMFNFLVQYENDADYGCYEKVLLLLKLGAINVNRRSKKGYPPLFFTWTKRMFDLLIEYDADLDVVDYKGRNFAMVCCLDFPKIYGNETLEQLDVKWHHYLRIQDMIDYFYQKGGNYFARDFQKKTILHYIIEYGSSFLLMSRLDFFMNFLLPFSEDTFSLLISLVQSECFFLNNDSKGGSQVITILRNEVIERLENIVRRLEGYGFNVTENKLYPRDKTVHSILYHELIKQFSDQGGTPYELRQSPDQRPENHLLFDIILRNLLLAYRDSFAYQKVLKKRRALNME